MLSSVLGKKIGMTQLFDDSGKVVPVTVIDVTNWFVTQIKTVQKDGYVALQLGLLKKKYEKTSFEKSWIKNKGEYFSNLREVAIQQETLKRVKVGDAVKLENIGLEPKSLVKVTSHTRGLGFQGVVKRWGFKGGRASHGSNFHRIPGSIGNICAVGKVAKGKKLPGQYGNKRITVKGLTVINLDSQNGCLFIKGTIPGKKNSLVVISKQG